MRVSPIGNSWDARCDIDIIKPDLLSNRGVGSTILEATLDSSL